MAPKRKSGEYHEGNIVPDMVGFDSNGNLVFEGDRARSPEIVETDDEIIAKNPDGSIAFRIPKTEQLKDDEWYDAFRDPNNDAIEIEDAGTATGELFREEDT